MNKTTGLTKDVGYQVGARKTISIQLEEAWEWMFSTSGIKIWLGLNEPNNFKITCYTKRHSNQGDGAQGPISRQNDLATGQLGKFIDPAGETD
jgi:hypothetical protein